MMIVPLQALASQSFQVPLNGQACALNVYQKGGDLYLDLSVSGVAIQQGKQCRDRVLIVRHAYLGFQGDLAFVDTQGVTDPVYTGFNPDPAQARYLLVYLAPADLPKGVA